MSSRFMLGAVTVIALVGCTDDVPELCKAPAGTYHGTATRKADSKGCSSVLPATFTLELVDHLGYAWSATVPEWNMTGDAVVIYGPEGCDGVDIGLSTDLTAATIANLDMSLNTFSELGTAHLEVVATSTCFDAYTIEITKDD